ncbi:MAG: peptidyl-prolyl cis-trans isomerase [Hyphomicrobiales bacterium]|nr:MAG: peptidyl-prolyl cis-trans isomerase [Hyphomicrobiales bacterium]
MFESIRKHSKIVMFLLFLLIIPSFVLVGIDNSYFSEKSPVVARVDGHDITQADWENAHRQEVDRIRAQSPTMDGRLLDSPSARYATLERMVRDRVLQAAAKDMHLITSDARLARELQGIPAIANLKRADGSLDGEAYRALVGAQGLTPEGFETNVRREISVNQVMGSVMASTLGSNAQSKLALDALYQRREIQVANFNTADFASKIAPTDEDLQAYYKAHTSQFQRAEQASVEYLVLDLNAVRAGITLSEDDLRTYYKENLERLAGREERRVSHILINAPQGTSASERDKAKARATELLAQVRKSPSSFAELAKKNSQDPGSSASGGDLGYIGRGAMVKPFEDAVFALKAGEISDVVETDYGYHVIMLADIKRPPQPTFESLRASLEVDLKQQQAQRKFAEVAEAFANGVYEQSDSLQSVADRLKLKIQKADGVTRTPAAGATGALANPRFIEALFQPDSIEHKRNTEAVEIAASTMAAGRVIEYSAAQTLPFDAVRAQVKQLYINEKAAELARKEGETKLAAWKAATPASASTLSAAMVVSRDQPRNQPRQVLDAALHAPVDALPAWTGVDLGAQGYAVVKVTRVIERDPADQATALQQHQQYMQSWASAEALAYYDLLKQRLKVQIKAPRPVQESL